MNVLLVYPKYPNTFWSFKYVLNFISRKAAFPPLGLLTVASMLPNEWDKKLIDLNVNQLKEEHIEWADIVFIGAMIVQKESSKEIIKRCKQKGKRIVAGGPLFTTGHENFKEVDHFVLNEAEITLPLFLRDLRDGNPKPIYTSSERPDITKTPIPSWNLINIKDYATMDIQYSRGCPFNCEFCDIIVMNGRIPRTKTVEQILKEFESIYNTGWRGSVFIVDDNFIGNKLKVKELLPHIVEWQKTHNYPFALFTEASINLADDKELMQMMRAANFYKVFVGIETPNVGSLKECAKTQNIKRDLVKDVQTIQQYGMQVLGGFIVGFDNDKEDIFGTQVKFIQKTGIVIAMVGILNAMPQTRLWNRLKSEQRLTGEVSGENTDGNINFIPRMGKKKLLKGYQWTMGYIYNPVIYYKRIDTFLKNYKPSVKGRVSKLMLSAFFKSMWKIGVVSNSRFHYWKLLIKTFFTKIRLFSTAVELSIHGLHFEKVSKNISTTT